MGSWGGKQSELFSESTVWDIPGSKETDLIEDASDPSTLRMFTAALLFSAVSSFVGAWSVLFSKSLTYIASALPDSIYDWYTWLILVAFVASAGFWVRQSDKGLKLYPATLIMPLMQAFWLAMSVLQGMIYFDEVAHLMKRSLLLLMLGLVMAIAGALLMGLDGWRYYIASKKHRGHHRTSSSASNDILTAEYDVEVATNGEGLNSPSLGSTGSFGILLAEQTKGRTE